MCGSMVDIQSPTAEISEEIKKKKKKKKQDENIMVCPTPQGDHNITDITQQHADIMTFCSKSNIAILIFAVFVVRYS